MYVFLMFSCNLCMTFCKGGLQLLIMLRISMHYPRSSVSLRFFSGHFSGLTAWVQPNSDKFHVITSKMSIVAYGIHTSVSILRLNYDDNLLPNKLAPWNKKRKKSMLLSRMHQHDKQSRNFYMPSPCVPASFLYNSRFRTDVNTSTPRYVWGAYHSLAFRIPTSVQLPTSSCSQGSHEWWQTWQTWQKLWWSHLESLWPLSLSLDHFFPNVPQNIKVWAGKEMLCTIWAYSMSVRHVLKQSWRGDTKVLAKFEFLSTQNHHGGQFFWQGMWVHVFESSRFRCLNLWWICRNYDQHSLNEKTARGASGLSGCLYPN